METNKEKTVLITAFNDVQSIAQPPYPDSDILAEIVLQYRQGKTCFIVWIGSAFGLLAGEAIITAKELYPDIEFIAVIEENQSIHPEYQDLFETVLNDSNEHYIIGEEYKKPNGSYNMNAILDVMLEKANVWLTFYNSKDADFFPVYAYLKHKKITTDIQIINLMADIPEELEATDEMYSLANELACDLALRDLMNFRQKTFKELTEKETKTSTRYKSEYQDEFDQYYDFWSYKLTQRQLSVYLKLV